VLRLKRRSALSSDSPSLTRISDILFPPLDREAGISLLHGN
jgi:hypothetical protein